MAEQTALDRAQQIIVLDKNIGLHEGMSSRHAEPAATMAISPPEGSNYTNIHNSDNGTDVFGISSYVKAGHFGEMP
jgi:hypothetical protein